MGLQFTDGFDSYAPGLLTSKWGLASSPWDWDAVAGRKGGGGALATASAGGVLKNKLATFNAPTLVAAFWLKLSGCPLVGTPFMKTLDSFGNPRGYVQIGSSIPAGSSIGVHNKAQAISTTLTAASLTTSSANSFIFAALFDATIVTISLPTHYTSIASSTTVFGSYNLCYETIAGSGAPTDAISVSIPSSDWHSYKVEVEAGVGTAPTFVNQATPTGGISNISGSPNMPTGRLNGNILIAWILIEAGTNTVGMSGAGWTIIDQQTSAGLTTCLAWRRVDGSETAPTFTWQTATEYTTNITQLGNFAHAFLQLISETGTVLASGTTEIADTAWHWNEVYISNSTLAVTNKAVVDGVSQWNGTFVTASSIVNIDSLEFLTIQGVQVNLDDVIAWDDSAGYPQLASYPIGLSMITTKRPASDVATQLLPFPASPPLPHYTHVNGVTQNPNSYVYGSSVTNQDLYTYSSLGFSPVTVKGVMLNSVMAAPGGVSASLGMRNLCKHTTLKGTVPLSVPGSPTILQSSFPTDPNGGGSWTGASVDAAQFGVQVDPLGSPPI